MQKPRTLNASESEERGYGEGVGYHRVQRVGCQFDIPTMSTPAFSTVLRLGVMCGAEKVNQLFNRPVMSLFDTRMNGTSTEMVSHRIQLKRP